MQNEYADLTNDWGTRMGQKIEPGAIINTSPRPRMLVRGFTDRPEVIASLLELCPTARHIESFREVRQAEWDLVVTDTEIGHSEKYVGITKVEQHLFVVYCAQPEGYIQKIEGRESWHADISAVRGEISQEFQRVRNLPDRIATLTHEQLEPVLKSRKSHTIFSNRYAMTQATEDDPVIEPFIMTPEGEILAGRYPRSDSAEAWVLPDDTPDLVAWVKAALAEWHTMAPDRFPGNPEWFRTASWQTASELKISAEITENACKRQAEMERYDRLDAALRTELAKANEAADSYERALLTTQSDDLKLAVMRALTEIGFSVKDADGEADKDDHLEDLHITDPEAPGWISLGEVKGYTKGARTEGLTQFLRFTMRYSARAGRIPDACWYIVNQFAKRDPESRQPALHGKDEDVDAFGSANGLVIDTVTLFRLLERLRDGSMTVGEAKAMLKRSTGRFTIG